MNFSAHLEQDDIFRRVHSDLIDSLDEELEMEVDDDLLSEAQIPETKLRKRLPGQCGDSISGNCSACRASS
jgi:hypothetical protein